MKLWKWYLLLFITAFFGWKCASPEKVQIRAEVGAERIWMERQGLDPDRILVSAVR